MGVASNACVNTADLQLLCQLPSIRFHLGLVKSRDLLCKVLFGEEEENALLCNRLFLPKG